MSLVSACLNSWSLRLICPRTIIYQRTNQKLMRKSTIPVRLKVTTTLKLWEKRGLHLGLRLRTRRLLSAAAQKIHVLSLPEEQNYDNQKGSKMIKFQSVSYSSGRQIRTASCLRCTTCIGRTFRQHFNFGLNHSQLDSYLNPRNTRKSARDAIVKGIFSFFS